MSSHSSLSEQSESNQLLLIYLQVCDVINGRRQIAHLSDWLFTGVPECLHLCIRRNYVIHRVNINLMRLTFFHTADAVVRRKVLKDVVVHLCKIIAYKNG